MLLVKPTIRRLPGLEFGAATSDRVDFGSAASLDNLDPYTLLMWIHPTTLTALRALFAKSTLAAEVNHVAINDPTDELWCLRGRATSPDEYLADINLVTGVDRFIAVVYSSAAATGERFNVYAGDRKTPPVEASYSAAMNGSGAITSDATNNLYIGNHTSNATAFQGRVLGSLAVIAGALTAEQIVDVWNDWEYVRAFDARINTFLGLNGRGTVYDRSGNGNHGTITGATVVSEPALALRPRRSRRLWVVPAGNIVVSPAPASAAAATVNPTVILGSLAIAPAPAAAAAATLDPTVVLGSVAVAPAPAAAVAAIVDPTVILGSLAITPAPAAAVAATLDPSIVLGSIAIAPAPAAAVATTLDPTVVLGSLTITPAPAAAVAATVDPTVNVGGLVVSPAAASAAAATVDPAVILGSIAIAPAPAAAVATTLAPNVVLGSLSIAPAAAAARALAVDPGVIISVLTVPSEGFTLAGRNVNFTLPARDLEFDLRARPSDLVNPKEK